MNRLAAFFFFALVGVGAFSVALGPLALYDGARGGAAQTASVFFIESVTPEVLKQTALSSYYTQRKLRILIVPGHDNEYWGTQFRGLKEAALTLELAKELRQLLAAEASFEVILARDDGGYNPALRSYFSDNREDILAFARGKKEVMKDLLEEGRVTAQTDGVYHNKAPDPVIVRLYGINKWANENEVDLVVHVHFNDYPRKKKSAAGQYSGFSIYVPERQYSNARASRAVADSVFRELKRFYPESSMPKESAGVIEDQDLIAIGSFNTLDPASILIEYGYIYEPQFEDAAIRSAVVRDLALQTYVGIQNSFGRVNPPAAGKHGTALLPYAWSESTPAGARNNPSVLALQVALALQSVYPPKGTDPHECPLAGSFGACTKKALSLFQQKHGIREGVERLGDATRAKLNELYGE